MKPSTKRVMFVIIAVAFILGAIFVYSTLISKSYSGIKELRSKLESEKVTLKKYQDVIKKIDSLASGIENLPSVQNQVSLILPKDKDSGYLVNQIVGLAKINGLSIQSLSTKVNPIQPSKSSVIKNLGKLSADVEFSGTYSGFKSFLGQIETNILILDTDNIKITKQDGKDGGIKYGVSVMSYYQVK